MKGIILASSVYLAYLVLFALGAPGWPLLYVLASASLLTFAVMLVFLLAASRADSPAAEMVENEG